MVLRLKDYQEQLLDALEAFLSRTRELQNPTLAFWESTKEAFGYGLPYSPLPGAEQVPYVCLRVPTGGGKTRIAGQAIARVKTALLASEYPLVLWLVPSEPILQQTLHTLKTRGELLSSDMRELFGAVNVLDINQALYMTRSSVTSGVTIIVATMQSFKRDTADGLRTYRQNGALMSHFEHLPPELKGDHSLVDAIRLQMPFIIVDEAHNQGTPLAVDTLVRLNPSCVLELTATPDRSQQPSNVLRSVSAATLQAEDMLKLPLELAIHPEWRTCLTEAIARLRTLEQEAQAEQQLTGETIRPVIMLIQAERKNTHNESFTPERVKQFLTDDYQIPAAQIAIATGAVDELGSKTLADPDYPQFIITVDKLREGWDCPFAYVLFSFRNTTSATAVEQVLGRVLRMPHVKRKQREVLNRSYAYVVSDQMAATVQGLRDGLVQSGFERLEAKDLINLPDAPSGDLFAPQQDFVANLPIHNATVVTPSYAALTALPKSLRDKIEVSPETGTLTIKGGATTEQIRKIADTFQQPEAAKAVRTQLDSVLANSLAPPERKKTPAERGIIATVPLLGLHQYGFFDVFDSRALLDADWELTDFDPKLTSDEFSPDADAMHRAQLSISQAGKLQLDFYARLDNPQLMLNHLELGWTATELVIWLDKNIPFPYADQPQKVAWLNQAIQHLLEERGFTLEELAYRKFRLRGALERKMAAGLVQAKQTVFTDLFKDETRFAVRDEHSITLKQGGYAYNQAYSGFIRFKHHFFTTVGDLNPQGEEFECAQRIDQLDNIDWWVRNVDRKPNSFWLQTSKDRYYPDFLVRLKSGVTLAVEYKGGHIAEYDKEKRQIGELWARRSGGRCRFVWVENQNWQVLKDAVS